MGLQNANKNEFHCFGNLVVCLWKSSEKSLEIFLRSLYDSFIKTMYIIEQQSSIGETDYNIAKERDLQSINVFLIFSGVWYLQKFFKTLREEPRRKTSFIFYKFFTISTFQTKIRSRPVDIYGVDLNDSHIRCKDINDVNINDTFRDDLSHHQ